MSDQTPLDNIDPPTPRETASTFEGRLQLDSFMYNDPASSSSSSLAAAAAASSSPRRSTRISNLTSPGASSGASTPGRGRSNPLSPSLARVTKERSTSSTSKRSNTNGSGKRKQRSRSSSGYAPPSTYAHLDPLQDIMAPDLLVIFVGLNPGIQTARSGHAYAHPSNLFWKLLASSGVTTRLCRPDEDRDLPRLFACGNTNIVARPSRNGSELSRAEMDDGVAALEEKARTWRPESMCVVGKSIWESIWRVRHGGKAVGKNFRYGWQDDTENMGVIEGEWAGAKVFVASSTSGLAATLSPAEKQKIWDELGVWVTRRRVERALEKRQPQSRQHE